MEQVTGRVRVPMDCKTTAITSYWDYSDFRYSTRSFFCASVKFSFLKLL